VARAFFETADQRPFQAPQRINDDPPQNQGTTRRVPCFALAGGVPFGLPVSRHVIA
jgi:hypothetical protein